MLAQALEDFERILCPGCGHSLMESMDQKFENDWEAGLPHRCHACTAIAQRAEQYRESDAASALRFAAHRRTPHRPT